MRPNDNYIRISRIHTAFLVAKEIVSFTIRSTFVSDEDVISDQANCCGKIPSYYASRYGKLQGDKTDRFVLTLNVIKISLFPSGIRTVWPSSTPGKQTNTTTMNQQLKLVYRAVSHLSAPRCKVNPSKCNSVTISIQFCPRNKSNWNILLITAEIKLIDRLRATCWKSPPNYWQTDNSNGLVMVIRNYHFGWPQQAES